MEDIVPETESKDHDDQGEGAGEKSSSGLLNHLLPRVVCRKESEKEKEDEIEEKRGGIISHLITKLVSPLSPKAGQNGVSVSKSEDQDVASHGGIMNNLIANLFHHSEDGKNGDDESDEIEESSEKKKVDKGTEKGEAEEESGVVGIIDNIVSHFPTSIPDDAVPTTDEASILIHSIVKD